MPELNSTGLTPRAWTAGDEVLVINEGGGSPDTIARVNGSIPLSMLADLATSTILGRVTGGTGAIEELTATQVRALLNVADGAQVNVATDLAYTAATRSLTSSTGTDVTLPLAGSDPGLMASADKTKLDTITGTNTGDQTTIVGITGTKAQFDTAVTDGNFMYVGDAPTSHTHVAADVTDFSTAVAATASVTANTAKVTNATHTGDVTGSGALTIAAGAVTLAKQADVATSTVFYRKTAGTGAPEVQTLATLKTDLGLTGTNSGDQTTIVGITGTKAQFDTAVTDGNILYVGDVTQYTDELAQDAVGAMVDGSLIYTDLTPQLSRAALTGAVTATQGSNATSLGSFTKAQLDTAVSDGNVMYVGDAPTAHTHLLAAGATDVTITAVNLNILDDGLNTALHFHDADRARAVHTGTQLASTISDFTETAQDAVGAMVDASLTYVDGTPLLQRAALTGAVTATAGSNATSLGSFTKAQLDTAVSDGNVLYVGDVTTNATHTGDVTGSTALTLDPTAISGKTLVTAVGADHVLIFDATDSLLKKALVSDLTGGGGATNLTYTAATRVIASDTGTDATLPLVTTGDAGLAPASGGGTTNFLRADGTWTSPGASSGPTLGQVIAVKRVVPLF